MDSLAFKMKTPNSFVSNATKLNANFAQNPQLSVPNAETHSSITSESVSNNASKDSWKKLLAELKNPKTLLEFATSAMQDPAMNAMVNYTNAQFVLKTSF
jgi:hypothetical protein